MNYLIPTLLAAAWVFIYIFLTRRLSKKFAPTSKEPEREINQIEDLEQETEIFLGFRALTVICGLLFVGFLFFYPVSLVYKNAILSDKKLGVALELFIYIGLMFVLLIRAWKKSDLDWLKTPSKELE